MKKIFTILFSVGMALSAAAQHGYQSVNDHNNKNDKSFASAGKNNYKQDNHQQDDKQWGYNQQNDNYKDKGYSNDDHYYTGKQQQVQEKNRVAAINRVNHDYDQQISRYKNDRSMNSYERDRRIAQAQRERQQKISSFGGGLIAGAIVGLIANVIFSH